VFGVVLISQFVGMAMAFILALLLGETMPTGPDLAWSVAGGIAGGIGIASLYRALAVGRMAVVAPVTAVLAASIPVVVGFAIDGLPNPIVMVGMGLGIVAVILVSGDQDEAEGRSRGLGLALVSGIGFGLFGVCISRLSPGHVFGPLAVVRATEAVMIAGVVVVARAPWRPPRELIIAICAVGVMDMTGNGAYILSVQAGSLAIAAVLSSMYPVTTVILATVFLRERVTRMHAFGIGLAVTAVILIAAGSRVAGPA
jgi:uncharacterized membrane protein